MGEECNKRVGRKNNGASHDFEAKGPIDHPRMLNTKVSLSLSWLFMWSASRQCWLSAILSHSSSSHFSQMTDAANRAASHQEDKNLLWDGRAVVGKLTLASIFVRLTPGRNSELSSGRWRWIGHVVQWWGEVWVTTCLVSQTSREWIPGM